MTSGEILVPPLNFAIVAPGIYRSGHPNKKNNSFLLKLQLKTIIYLSPDALTEDMKDLLSISSIRLFHLPMVPNKEPFILMEKEIILQTLNLLLNIDHHPVLVHCLKGKHRVGCVIGLLRKMQKWSLTAIFDEYSKFTGRDKVRLVDQELIEMFDEPVEVKSLPAWL